MTEYRLTRTPVDILTLWLVNLHKSCRFTLHKSCRFTFPIPTASTSSFINLNYLYRLAATKTQHFLWSSTKSAEQTTKAWKLQLYFQLYFLLMVQCNQTIPILLHLSGSLCWHSNGKNILVNYRTGFWTGRGIPLKWAGELTIL